jgi:processive 1,2-diacylglycerol beta-glucosyltransferase
MAAYSRQACPLTRVPYPHRRSARDSNTYSYNVGVTAQKADILILSSTIGSGHMRASAALTKGVKLLAPELDCLTVDFPREVSPTTEALLRQAYLESLKLMPDVYGRVYRMAETRASKQSTIHRASDVYERLAQISDLWATRYAGSYREGDPPEPHSHLPRRSGLRTLGRLAEETEAKVLVAPHFYGAGVLGKYKERNSRASTAVVLTDYVPHPVGVPPNLDLYVVADEAAAGVVERLGVPEKRIHPTGIPIDPAFEEVADVPGVRKDLLELPPKGEQDDLPVVIVMGGGLGGGHLESVVASLLEASAAMHLVILCGSNTSSCERLRRLAEKRSRSAIFLSFTDRVRDLMAASTVLVTKPGGMSCTEALASELPQVLFNPIPGQEEDNAAAMVRYGAGVMVESTEDILGETLKVLTSPNHRRRMVESARAAHHLHSATSAAKLVLDGIP